MASPLLACSSPAMIFSSDDLPVPLGPTTPILAPWRNERVTLSRTTLSPWALRTLRSVKTYSAMGSNLSTRRSANELPRRARRSPQVSRRHLPLAFRADGRVPLVPHADRLEEGAVVADHQQPAAEAGHRLLQLLDRGDVEVVGGLVQDEGLDRPALEHRH